MSEKSGLGRILKGAGAITAIVLVCKLLGFVEKLVVGHFWGTSYEADVYFGAFVFLIVFHEFAKGIAQPFLPVMEEVKEREGEAQAWYLFSILSNTVVVPFLAICLLVILLARPIAEVFYGPEVAEPVEAQVLYNPTSRRLVVSCSRGDVVLNQKKGWTADAGAGQFVVLDGPDEGQVQQVQGKEAVLTPTAGEWRAEKVTGRQVGTLYQAYRAAKGELSKERFEDLTRQVPHEDKIGLLARLIRIMFYGAVFLGLSAFTYLLLNSYKRFFAPALGDLTFKVLGLVGLVALMKWTGVVGGAVGIAVGGFGYLFVNAVALWKKRALYRRALDLAYPPLRQTVLLMAPLVLYMVFYLGRQFVDLLFALPMEGGVASLQYSYKLIEFPHRTLLEPFAIAIFPFFTTLAIAGKDEELADLLRLGLRSVALVFVPAACCLFVLRSQVIALLWPGFTEYSHDITVFPLALYAFAMVPLALEIVVTKCYVAKKDTWTPALLEVLAIAVHVGLILGLQESLAYSHGAIALGFTVSRTVKFLLMYALLRRHLPGMEQAQDGIFLVKVAVALAVMILGQKLALGVLLAQFGLAEYAPGLSRAKHALVLAAVGGGGVALFFLLAYLMRARELFGFFKLLKERRREKKAPAGGADGP